MNSVPTPGSTAKGNYSVSALMAQVPDLAALPSAGFASGRLQPSIAARPFPAPMAFPDDLAQGPIVPPLEATDTPAGDYKSHTRRSVTAAW